MAIEMLEKNNFSTCFVVSVVLHFIMLFAFFGIKQKPAFLSIPVEVFFYSANNARVYNDVNVSAEKGDIKQSVLAPERKVVVEEVANEKPVTKEDVVVKNKNKKENLKKNDKKNSEKKSVVSKTDTVVEDVSPDRTTVEDASPYESVRFENSVFKYQYYAKQIVQKIGQHWKWSQSYGKVRALVYFKIQKNGSIVDVKIEESSGSVEFDKYAIDTIHRVSNFAELPESYDEQTLGVFFEFKYQS
ncbi:MAG: TonB C-terminal domain-containing protein [Elusimicrobiota bacterium]|jgi:TonB family protein|nr:TonB C-terminal domain-containing protein [Elusimicrobiota bacterium]